MATVNLELLQQIIDYWLLTASPEQAEAALVTMAELKNGMRSGGSPID